MSNQCANSTYTILPLTEKEKLQALDFLKLTFFVLEPINQGVGLCRDGERCEYLEQYCLKDMLSGLSLRAVDQQGNIVGLTVSGVSQNTEQNYKDLSSSAESCTDAKFGRILRLLCQREWSCQLWNKYPGVSQFVEVKVASTHPRWGRRGIMTAMLQRTEELARSQGYPLLRMDTSSAYSARVADKLGMRCVSRLRYADVTLHGEPLTAPPHPHDEDRVYVKLLS